MPANKKNLKPISSVEEAREKGRKGGIKSAEVRREKKLMSQIYAEFLMKEHDVIGKNGVTKTLTGQQLLNGVMSKILSRGDSASVSLLKEVREGTEGSKVNLTADVTINAEETREKLKEKLTRIASNRTDKPAS
jgi:hypothetical protein